LPRELINNVLSNVLFKWGSIEMSSMVTKGFCLGLIALLFVAFAIPVTAMAVDGLKFRELKGNAAVWEKGKPSSPPGLSKPPKPDDDNPPEPDTSVNKWAVVIGIADYAGTVNDLKYTDDDAKDMQKYLLQKGYPAGNIKMLLDGQATAYNILDALDWLDSYENTDSEVVFFYSGHGSTYTDTNNIDGDGEYVDETIVSADLYLILDTTLGNKINALESDKIAIMFDSCFSGGMTDMAGPGRVLSTACGETELSYDGTARMKNGVWTYYFMNGLKTYNAVEPAHNYAAPLASAFISNSYGRTMTPLLVDGYSASIDGNWHF